ncbi:hypothetical protein AGABI1DRAFT_132102 [Agaricus bisporus var. burnettii JB137-S8]|uniref:Rpr2-domain-containing protein n=1 Tax=Agaricus bisporus var. burnettii (strain JB137-S8 / ATCC MYA-4627 / FGSC 10392) TaxID=597362 RepID=K5WYA5_AGABU|nr:uncharacterized protein AGABI1DRAFT_132102 [Agaricus bisporus var. burnettii JB137-S8]EKM75562.1 hypothetical protein AGABI1DRAFT_132102 [Agaricus bisporus var. burnettii JB137-S8]
MGKNDNKKSATEGKNGKGVNLAGINTVPNRDIMQRMNFLWQASVLLEGLGGSGVGDTGTGTSSGDGDSEVKGDLKTKKARTKKVNGSDLARMYVRTMNVVGQRTTTKMDPSVKRTICKSCSSVLIPGISARIRNRPSRQHQHLMIYTCLKCDTSRRIPAPRNGVIASPEARFGLGATATEIIDTSAENVQRLVQSSNPSHPHPLRQQQSQHHSEEQLGDKKDDIEMNEQQDHHTKRNIIDPREDEKIKSLTKQKKTKKKKKKVPTIVPTPREPPLFSRKDAGHVVYRSGEVIDMDGVYCI